eukprot:TRINITY_DN866_c0_g1_i1.p1 TRINITY_DN866_c0_g1~~TRINITY_DN866_c0_g1_i1.p1  ORF type:complete len:209 (+),score=57.25 TRINITY_DN866_c0_g1_i1:37-627(+)
MDYSKYIDKIYYTEDQIKEAVSKIAKDVDSEYQHSTDQNSLIIMPVMTGALFFAHDLIRELTIPTEFIPVSATAYFGGSMSVKELIYRLKPNASWVEGRDCLLCDDLYESGTTLNTIKDELLKLGARSVKLCLLLNKKVERTTPEPEFWGLEAPDVWLAGYGLDVNERMRELPFLCNLNEEGINYFFNELPKRVIV